MDAAISIRIPGYIDFCYSANIMGNNNGRFDIQSRCYVGCIRLVKCHMDNLCWVSCFGPGSTRSYGNKRSTSLDPSIDYFYDFDYGARNWFNYRMGCGCGFYSSTMDYYRRLIDDIWISISHIRL